MKGYKNFSQGIGAIPIIIGIGTTIALATFLVAFITTQKAATPSRYANLKLVVPTVPPKPSLFTKPVKISASPLPYAVSESSETTVLENELSETEFVDPAFEVDRLDTDINQL